MSTLDRDAEFQRIGAERLAAEREMLREARRAAVFTALACGGWSAIGVFLLGVALNVTDHQIGMIYFWSGLLLGNGGMSYSLLAFYRRGEIRGDW